MTARRWIYGFADALPDGADEQSLLGGKGASLRKLTAVGLRVPPGFTITTEACSAYFLGGRTFPPGLREELRAKLSELETITGRRFGDQRDPLLVAVRSGAAVSMPGMLVTILNCGSAHRAPNDAPSPDWSAYDKFAESFRRAVRDIRASGKHPSAPPETVESTGSPVESDWPVLLTAWEALELSIRLVFESSVSDRAMAYCKAMRIAAPQPTAVTIQSMLHPEMSGVLFTRDPLNSTADHMVLEVARGYGDDVVGGTAAVQRYHIARRTDHVSTERSPRWHRIDNDRADASLIDQRHIDELSRAVETLEPICGDALDIEWAWADGQAVFFQVRPQVRTELPADSLPALIGRQCDELHAATRAGARMWIRHNLDETLPHPTPLTWDCIQRLMGVQGGYTQIYRELGYCPAFDRVPNGYLRLIFGRIYCDPDQLAQLFWTGLPLCYDLDELRKHPERLALGPQQFDLKRLDPWLLFRLPVILWRSWRIRRRTARLMRAARERFEHQFVPHLSAYISAQRQIDLTKLSAEQLVELFERRCAKVLGELAAEALRPGFFGAIAYGQLETDATLVFGSSDGPRWARRLTHGLTAASPTLHLVTDWTNGSRSLDELLERLGHRGPGEMELARPRWRETLGQLRAIATGQPAGSLDVSPEMDAGERFEEVRREFVEQLSQAGAASLARGMFEQVTFARELLPYREIGRDYFLRAYELLREVLEELAARTGFGADIYFLEYNELAELARGANVRARARERRACWEILREVTVPEVISPTDIDALARRQREGEVSRAERVVADSQRGVPLSSGRAAGPAFYLDSSSMTQSIPPGSVLVCHALEPALAALAVRAAALVVHQGGLLSHGAIVARQLGIPAIVCPAASGWIRQGERVIVDADGGRVIREART